ncbi:MAG TPA: hypothetical protein VLA56_20280 [Pseudomonadales bacterium]|nr:hypothetical protein [Pseudomonadales bacterium]
MKVFVPFFEGALEDARETRQAFEDADLVPFSLHYPILRITAARADDPPPEPGEAQIIAAEAFGAHVDS